MTRDETKAEVLKIIAIYPGGNLAKLDDGNLSLTITAWAGILADFNFKDIDLALDIYVRTSGSAFGPSVSELIEAASKPQEMAYISEGDAWNLVDKALRNSLYNAEKEFVRLPEIIQKTVGSPEQLHNWAATDAKTIETVVASNFRATYMRRVKEDQQYKRMPEAAQRLLQLQNTTLKQLECGGSK